MQLSNNLYVFFHLIQLELTSSSNSSSKSASLSMLVIDSKSAREYLQTNLERIFLCLLGLIVEIFKCSPKWSEFDKGEIVFHEFTFMGVETKN